MLVALAWPNHVHHRPAHKWFAGLKGRLWATTAFTEAGFVRVSSNSSAIPAAVSAHEALQLLRRLRLLKGHRFLSDDVELVVGDQLAPSAVGTYRQVTDAHLLALAKKNGARLATFDVGIASLDPERKYFVLIPFDRA